MSKHGHGSREPDSTDMQPTEIIPVAQVGRPTQQNSGGPPHLRRGILLALAIAGVAAIIAIALPRGGGNDYDYDIEPPGYIGGICRQSQPEQYLRAALARTREQLDFAPFDLAHFAGQPLEQGLALRIDELYDPRGRPHPFMGVGGDLQVLTDPAADGLLLNFDFGSDMMNFRGNRLYLAPDLIALSAPDLYSRHEFVSVDPRTLAQDWAGWAPARMLPFDPAPLFGLLPWLDVLPEAINPDAALGALQAAAGLMSAGQFRDAGDTQIVWADAAHNVARLGYYIPGAMLRELVAFVRLPHGLTLHAYVCLDTGYVLRLGVSGLAVEVPGHGEGEVDAFFYLPDDTGFALHLAATSDNVWASVQLGFIRAHSQLGLGVWIVRGDEQAMLDLSGVAGDTDGALTLENGRIFTHVGEDRLLAANFDYTLRTGPPGHADFERDVAVNLFDISTLTLIGDLIAAAMRLMML